MTSLYDSQDFYKKMLDLQEKLRKSEQERMKLEERFNILSQESRNRREACINNLRMRYIDFLEEQRLRDERNHQILGALDKIDGSLSRMTARTDRLGILRKQYEAYLLRLYANRNTSGGTGDSGVGSQNEEKLPKFDVPQSEKVRPTTQRGVTQSGDCLPNFIGQTNYARSQIGTSNISQFDVPRYQSSGKEYLQQVNVLTHGQGNNNFTTKQPHNISQSFYDSKNINPATKMQQPIKNASQQFIPSDRNFPQHFLQSDQFIPNPDAQIKLHRTSATSEQYPENLRMSFAIDQPIMQSKNLPAESEQNVSSNLRTSFGSISEQIFGPYRHSTPLPGYLDYSTRYNRDISGQEINVPLHSGFTRSDLEKMINRNEKILPRDYLHNPETVRNIEKLSSLLEDKQKVADAKSTEGTNDGDLDQYINRIRSLHRDNERSLEALDIEQNTSGDLLNATLSDDGTEPLSLHSDDKIKTNMIKNVSNDVKNILALADDFITETGVDVNSKSVFKEKIGNEDIAVGSTAAKPNDFVGPVALKSNMTLENLSISTTRDDILSGTTSLDLNRVQEIGNDKFKSKFIEPKTNLDTQTFNFKDVAAVYENKSVELNELPQQKILNIEENEFDRNENFNNEESKLKKITSNGLQTMINDRDIDSKETEIHEDIEGDEVSLIKGEKPYDQIIDVVKELEPPSLQHYEKNVVEIHIDDKNNKESSNVKKILTESVTKENESTDFELKENENNVPEEIETVKIIPKNFIDDNKIHALSHISDKKYSNEENESEKNILQNANENDVNQILEQSSNNEQFDDNLIQNENEYDNLQQSHANEYDQTYDSNKIYNTDKQYEAESNEQYEQESVQQDAYDLNKNFEDKPNADYVADPNEQFVTNLNEEYATEIDQNQEYRNDTNEQYETDKNQHYQTDPTEHYTNDPNQQYVENTNEQYVTNLTDNYPNDPNEHYQGDSSEQYGETDPNEQYSAENYVADPNEQYEYYQNDPNLAYNENTGGEQYDYDINQDYKNDPNQQYEQDANQQYHHDPNQQFQNDPNESNYMQDPNQQFEKDPNESNYMQDSNQEYKEQEYESVNYGESVQFDENQQPNNGLQQNYENDDLAVTQSSNQNYPNVIATEQNEIQASSNDPDVQKSLDFDKNQMEENLVEEKKKDKDVIKALLESDTESTIERNPSNNTESDFDFN